jgi:hypothetical protein
MLDSIINQIKEFLDNKMVLEKFGRGRVEE